MGECSHQSATNEKELLFHNRLRCPHDSRRRHFTHSGKYEVLAEFRFSAGVMQLNQPGSMGLLGVLHLRSDHTAMCHY